MSPLSPIFFVASQPHGGPCLSCDTVGGDIGAAILLGLMVLIAAFFVAIAFWPTGYEQKSGPAPGVKGKSTNPTRKTFLR